MKLTFKRVSYVVIIDVRWEIWLNSMSIKVIGKNRNNLCTITYYYHSIKAPVCQRVCLSVCLFVPKLFRNGEPQGAEILKDDSPWDKEGFRLKNCHICWTFSWKILSILAPHFTLAVNFISLQCDSLLLRCVACWVIGWGEGIGEVGREWGDLISDRISYRPKENPPHV